MCTNLLEECGADIRLEATIVKAAAAALAVAMACEHANGKKGNVNIGNIGNLNGETGMVTIVILATEIGMI